jgi:hypothetical protein
MIPELIRRLEAAGYQLQINTFSADGQAHVHVIARKGDEKIEQKCECAEADQPLAQALTGLLSQVSPTPKGASVRASLDLAVVPVLAEPEAK